MKQDEIKDLLKLSSKGISILIHNSLCNIGHRIDMKKGYEGIRQSRYLVLGICVLIALVGIYQDTVLLNFLGMSQLLIVMTTLFAFYNKETYVTKGIWQRYKKDNEKADAMIKKDYYCGTIGVYITYVNIIISVAIGIIYLLNIQGFIS